jgi:hypothetical protein
LNLVAVELRAKFIRVDLWRKSNFGAVEKSSCRLHQFHIRDPSEKTSHFGVPFSDCQQEWIVENRPLAINFGRVPFEIADHVTGLLACG